MKNSIYFLLIIISMINLSCSNNDDSNKSEIPQNTTSYKITFKADVDGMFNGSEIRELIHTYSTYIFDDKEEEIMHSSSVKNDFIIAKINTVEAEKKVGLKLSVWGTVDVKLHNITVKIENSETSEVLVEESLNKSIVNRNPDINSALEISVIYNIQNRTVSITD